jgi:Staphylococcal nuclease homologue
VPAPVSLGRSANGQTDKVRLIVVDALEITERSKHVEYYGRDASRFTTDLRKDKRTRLEIQTSPTSQDRHGRLLAFFVQSRKLICYLLIAAFKLRGSGVGMDPIRLRAATGGANGNWERSLYLRKR